MGTFADIFSKFSNFDYALTLIFVALVLIFTIPYMVLVPPQNYHNNPDVGWRDYVLFTSPFNIGPETAFEEPQRQQDLVSNLGVVTFFVFLFESTLNIIDRRLKWRIFFVAIVASYITTAISIVLSRQVSAGTSIIGVSMAAILPRFSLLLVKRKHQPPFQFAVSALLLVLAVAVSLWALILYFGNQSAIIHAIGVFIFLYLFFRPPKWFERSFSWIQNKVSGLIN